MSRDPYSVLGVPKSAGAAEIKKAYRKLAKAYHPDSNSGDPKAQERFAEATAAYDLLSDKDKRARYDRGEIDASGNPRFTGFEGFANQSARSGGFQEGPGGMRWSFSSSGGGLGGIDPDDIISEILGGRGFSGFGGGATGTRRRTGTRGADLHLSIDVDLADAVHGATKRVRLPNGSEVDLKIPAGIQSGKQIRLKGKGEPGQFAGAPGDALVTVNIRPHPQFSADGYDLRHEIPVPLADAVLGGRVRVPTLEGAVDLKVPAWSSGGRTMRLKGKGLPKPGGGRGDLLASIRIVLPDKPDPELEELMRRRRDG